MDLHTPLNYAFFSHYKSPTFLASTSYGSSQDFSARSIPSTEIHTQQQIEQTPIRTENNNASAEAGEEISIKRKRCQWEKKTTHQF
jgi:hypothetical protein